MAADIPVGSRARTSRWTRGSSRSAAAFESLTVGRPYRPMRSDQAAIDEIRHASGTQFDPKVVEALVRSVTELLTA